MDKSPSERNTKTRLRKLNRVAGAEALAPNAPASDHFKYELCERIVQMMVDKEITQREMAKVLGVDEARVSEVVHYRLKKLTVDRLMRRALNSGQVESNSGFSPVAFSLCPPRVGVLTLGYCRVGLDEVVTVSDDQIKRAMRELFENTSLMVEGAGATPLAALKGPLSEK